MESRKFKMVAVAAAGAELSVWAQLARGRG